MMEAEYLTTGIALHYSTPSLHAASITNNQPENEIYSIPNYELKKDVINRNYGADQDGWVKIINDLGMQFKFVAYKDIEVLKLQEDNYKIFVMPFSMAISEEEAAAIREFVKNGGVVISDGAGGIMNDHCSWQEKGMLDDLFGISAPISRERELKGITGKVEVTKEGEAYKLDAKKLKGLEALEPNIKAEQAKSLISIDGESAVFANKYGKGYAFQLNILLDQYPNLRENNYGGETHRYLLSKILSYVNIRPDIKVFTSDSNQLERALISRYKMGNSKLIAIVKEYTGEKALMSKDGVTPDEIIKYEENLEVQNINIMLPEKYYVYDVRKGKEMGFTDKIKTSITDGDAVVIGLSPEKNTINISGPGEISPGVQPEFIVSSELERPQVIRCHLFGPEGEYIPAYSQNIILKKGKGKVIFPLTLSDIEGEYKIEISDVITGASEETSFRIK